MEEKYIPINCDFYDEIELRALRKSKCSIVFRNEQNEEETVVGIITNVYAKNKEEFLVINNEVKFRLDRLISIDGKLVPNAC